MAKPAAVVRSLCVLLLVLIASATMPAREVSFVAVDDDVFVHRFEEPELWTTVGQLRGNTLLSNDTCDGAVCGEERLRIVSFTQPLNGLVRPVFATDAFGNPTTDIANLQYIGRGGHVGDDTFTYTAQDTQTGETSIASVLVHVLWDGTEPAYPQPADDVITLDPCVAAPCAPVAIMVLDNDWLLESCMTTPTAGCPAPPPEGYGASIIDAIDTTLTAGAVSISPAQPRLVTYTPTPGFSGDDEFTYAIVHACQPVGEGQFACADTGIDVPGRSAIVRVHVRAPNQAPTAQDASYSASANTAFTGTLVYSDPDGDALAISLLQPPSSGVLTLAAPTFSYTPSGASQSDAFTFRVSDGRGGSATATISFSIPAAVTTPPVISGTPMDMVVNATGSAGAVVSYSSPTAVDADGGSVAVSCAPASGSTFALGVTTVTCNATDAHGNAATPTTFTVTVSDTTAPTIDAHTAVTAQAMSAAGAVVTYSAPATHDVVDGTGVASCAPASGSTFALGVTTVTCTATDTQGNAAAPTTFTVTVSDTTAPTIDAHAAVTAQATSAAGAVVTYSAPATHDAVDGAGVASCAPVSGSTFALGATTVTCTATDTHGNAATPTTFTVTVSDTTAPTIDAHAAVTAQATSAAGAVVTYSAPATHDAVDGAGVAACAPASGSTFALGVTTVTCTATDTQGNAATPTTFTVTVTSTTTGNTPGTMSGEGIVLAGGDKYHFEFQVRENASGERGQFQLEVNYAKRTVLDKNGRPRQVDTEDGKFRSTGLTSVVFSDDPTIRPGRASRPQVDTVLFTGVGRWNGQSGYTFEVRANDQGEPGRHRESVSIVIRNAAGQIVAQAAGDLASGNVQSGRIKH